MDFEDDKTFYTETMARVYAGQGRHAAAARIYRYLLSQTPDRKDLEEALAGALSMLPEGSEQWAAASGLIDQWVRLMLRQQALRRLHRVRLRQTVQHPPAEKRWSDRDE